ncbi:2TM domain-containing protein [Flavobacterium sp.]|uniref:2TM domain-containing protein n=1 Tax=Flavobacterium sp. TaxID=239 RepID=UPI00260EC070|nr:2TM domain-containing protein [Flavobacterium sp.]MDD3003916.1 2TM domain-containing protein [Flavobacterium sp.]
MQSKIQYFIQSIFKGFIISIIIAFIVIGIEWAFGRVIVFNNSFLHEIAYFCVYGIVLTILNSSFFDFINHKVHWGKYAKYRLFIGIIGSISLTMSGIFFIRMIIKTVIEGISFIEFVSNEKLKHYVFSLIITMVVSLFFYTIYFYKKSQEKKVKQQKIIAGTASAQFESLKNQIDPHFLFNSLNVLSSLIEENPENAQRFTTSLSKIYRYVLEQKDKELVPVSEELAFAKTYMNLLKMRFENSLFYEMPNEMPSPEAKVVPLSLQLLLENTVKHNVVSEQKPLYIRIKIQDNNLIIENDLQKKEVLGDREGVGLQNIMNRYAILTHRKMVIEETKNQFSVSLPILTKQISIMENTDTLNEERYLKAQKRVEDLKGFYGNLSSYIIVNFCLMILNLVTSPSHLWFFYPLLGWGIGVAIHAMSVFNYMPFLNRDWEEKKIKELMNKEKTNQWK